MSQETESNGQKRQNGDATFPKTVEGFGYGFNDQGQLRNLETGEPFKFDVSDDRTHNQERYEALGLALDEYVFELLETRGQLKRIYIPTDASDTDARSFIFLSDDVLSNPDKLLVLIHGTGVVRAGQWARRVIINDNINDGTQLPYIERARNEGYGIIVLNTNLNRAHTADGDMRRVRGSESPEAHAQEAKAKNIYIVAHSYGGVVTVALAEDRFDECTNRVTAIAFTDSVHSSSRKSDVRNWMKQRCCNWIQSDEPLDTKLKSGSDCERVSAGTEEHVYTSPFAMASVFDFFTRIAKEKSTTFDHDEADEKQPHSDEL